jgi:hypothetical protein
MVHSNVKQPDGRRMALQLLRKVYGQARSPRASLSLSDNPNINAPRDTYGYICY